MTDHHQHLNDDEGALPAQISRLLYHFVFQGFFDDESSSTNHSSIAIYNSSRWYDDDNNFTTAHLLGRPDEDDYIIASVPPSDFGDYYNYSTEDFDSEDVLLPPLTNQPETMAARILPRITGFVSLLGVLCVAIEAYGDIRGSSNSHNNIHPTTISKKRRRQSSLGTTRQINNDTVNHIQFFYQLALFCYSLVFVLGSIPAPSDQSIWGAYGNQATCTIQGVLFQFGMFASMGWDIALSTTYWTMTRGSSASPITTSNRRSSRSNNNQQQHKKPWKQLWHAFIWPIALGVSIYPLVTTDLYNFNVNFCWINEYPNDCHFPDNPHECIRGGKGALMWTNVASLAASLHLVYNIGIMISLYCSIRKLEAAMEERRRLHQEQSSQLSSSGVTVATKTSAGSTTTIGTRYRYSRKIAIQGLLYASGMTITMLPTAIMVLLANFADYWSFGLSAFCLTMVPLTGYINFFIYLRNRSLEQCHSKYAKGMRKVHGCFLECDCCKWIWKQAVRFVVRPCCCWWWRLCRRSNNKHDDDNNQIFHVNSTIPITGRRTKSEPLESIQEEGCYDEESPHRLADGGKAPPMPAVRAATATDTDVRASTNHQREGKWTGFLIKVKDPNQQRSSLSQWISELGASSCSHDEDEDDDEDSYDEAMHDEEDDPQLDLESGDGSRDNPPSYPRRIQSTYVSELDVEEEKVEEDEETTGSGRPTENHCGSICSSDMMVPPCKPVRFVSELDASDSNSNNDDHVVQVRNAMARGGSGDDDTTTTTPPVMPVRFVSELDTSDNSNGDNNVVQVRNTMARGNAVDDDTTTTPPIMPVRVVSEVEATDEDDDEDVDMACNGGGNHHDTSTKSLPSQSCTVITKTTAATSTPPIMPVRFVSEVEANNNKDTHEGINRKRNMKTVVGQQVSKLLRLGPYVAKALTGWTSERSNSGNSHPPSSKSKKDRGVLPPVMTQGRPAAVAAIEGEPRGQEQEPSPPLKAGDDTGFLIQWKQSQIQQVSELGASEICYTEPHEKWDSSIREKPQDCKKSLPFQPVRATSEETQSISSYSSSEMRPGSIPNTSSASSSSSTSSRTRSYYKNNLNSIDPLDSAPARPIRTISEFSALESIDENLEMTESSSCSDAPTHIIAMDCSSPFRPIQTISEISDLEPIDENYLGGSSVVALSDFYNNSNNQKEGAAVLAGDSVPSRPVRVESEEESEATESSEDE